MDTFDIIDVSDVPEVQVEQMGSKDKFWIELDGERWLFKIPRPGTGEHWAEKCAAEIATRLELPAATVELAIRGDTRGTISKSFLEENQTLIHGNELMASYVEDYDKEKRFKHREHRLDLVLECVERNAEAGPVDATRNSPGNWFVGYLMLDALVANVDRHHENWAIIQTPQLSSRLAPTYDHASSLGRELSDHKREARMQARGIGHYLDFGRGGIYPPNGEERVPPVELLAELDQIGYSEGRQEWTAKLVETGLDTLLDVFARVPSDWMTEMAVTFARGVVETSFERITGIDHD